MSDANDYADHDDLNYRKAILCIVAFTTFFAMGFLSGIRWSKASLIQLVN